MPSHAGEIHQRLAKRIPTANAKDAKRRGAREKRTGSRSIAPMLRFAANCWFLRRGRFVLRGGASVVAMALSPEPCPPCSSAFEGDDGLQMKCLWEQVYQRNCEGSIPGWLQRTQVTGEGGGIAGDIDDLRRSEGGQPLADLCPQTGARRVCDHQIGPRGRRGLQETQCVCRDAFGR